MNWRRALRGGSMIGGGARGLRTSTPMPPFQAFKSAEDY